MNTSVYNIKYFFCANFHRFRTLGEILSGILSSMIYSLISQTQVWLDLSVVIMEYVRHELGIFYWEKKTQCILGYTLM